MVSLVGYNLYRDEADAELGAASQRAARSRETPHPPEHTHTPAKGSAN